jgi:Cu(I)/Ag(I) efflux system protein CusF
MKNRMIASTVFAVSLALSSNAIAQAPAVSGEVKKIDDSAGKITLKHGPIKSLGMDEGMTMVFRVKDLAMLKDVKEGDKVQFDADRIDGQITVTKIQKVK